MEVAAFGGDEVAEGPRAAVAGTAVSYGDEVGPAVGWVEHLDCLSQVLAELVKPSAFLAACRGAGGGEVGADMVPGQVDDGHVLDRCGQGRLRPPGARGGKAGQDPSVVGGDPRGIPGELRFAWEQPATFGLDDDQPGPGADLQVGPPLGVWFFQPQFGLLILGLRGQPAQDESEQRRAAPEGEGEGRCEVVLFPAQQVEDAGDFPAVAYQRRERGHDAEYASGRSATYRTLRPEGVGLILGSGRRSSPERNPGKAGL